MLSVVLLVIGAILVAAYKARSTANSAPQSALAGVNEFYDFINAERGTPFETQVTGDALIGVDSILGRSTLIRFTLPTISDSSAGIMTKGYSFVVSPGSSLTVSTDIVLAGDTTQTAGSSFKFGSSGTLFQGTDLSAAYLLADRSISDKWIAVRKNSSGTTQVITSAPVAIATPESAQFTRLKVVSDSQRSLYFVDAVLVATILNRAWSHALNDDHCGIAAKLATTTGDINAVYMDYVAIQFQSPTPRPAP